MKRTKSSTKNNSSKTKYTIKKNNVIFEDKSSPNVIFRLINDKNEPMYKHEIPKEKK